MLRHQEVMLMHEVEMVVMHVPDEQQEGMIRSHQEEEEETSCDQGEMLMDEERRKE